VAKKQPELSWEIDFPLITNSLVLSAWLKAMGAAYLVIMLILGTVLVGTGDAADVPELAGVIALVMIGLSLFGLLIMLVVFGNRFKARFTLTDKGITYEGVDSRARRLARITVVTGAITGSPRTTGAGLLAVSNERVDLDWSGAFEARFHPKQRTIAIRNQWRDLLHLYCTEENYEQVKQRVEQKLGAKGTTEQLSSTRSPLPGALFATLLVALAALPLFALEDILGLDLFVPLLILVFGLATVWLIPLFGWVVLPLEGYIFIYLVIALFETSELKLISTYRFRKYELLDAGDWIVMGLAIVGMIYLGVTAWRAVHGRVIPLLMRE